MSRFVPYTTSCSLFLAVITVNIFCWTCTMSKVFSTSVKKRGLMFVLQCSPGKWCKLWCFSYLLMSITDAEWIFVYVLASPRKVQRFFFGTIGQYFQFQHHFTENMLFIIWALSLIHTELYLATNAAIYIWSPTIAVCFRGKGKIHILYPHKWRNQEINLKFSRSLWFVIMNNIRPHNLLV